MSGGDLDGDVYMALWDKDIMEHFTNEKEPANYRKFNEDNDLKSDKIQDHIKRYFEKDNLGHLSNMHLALCDQLGKEWDLHHETEELSRLIGVAVDFAKHGKCVSPKDFRDIEKKLHQWPDYMETGNRGLPIVES
jgi:RNA-dependent RNA polymerase